jgi:hypothetical protein
MPKFTFSRISSMINAPEAINGVITQIESALDTLVSRDGATPNQLTNDVDMNSNRILNLVDPATAKEPVTLSYFQDTVQSEDAREAANEAAASAAEALTYRNAAQTAQTNAETAETNAETARDEAVDAKDTAVAARDALLLQSGFDFEYYVDSRFGSDSNTGDSPDQAFASLTALNTLLAGTYDNISIGLARGSEFSGQMLGSPTAVANRCEIKAYGSGKLPVIDPRSAASGWSKTGGFTNIYQIEWTPQLGSDVAPQMWEDGVRMTRVASQATCDSTPGSYYASTSYSNGVAAPLYVHASDSGDPASNGKTYLTTNKIAGIYLIGHYNRVAGVRAISGQSDNGCIVLRGRFQNVEDCVAQDGSKHHILIGSGNVRRCYAYKFDITYNVWSATTIIPFIAYGINGNVKDPVLWEDCVVLGEPGTEAAALSQGFFCHASTGGITSHGTARVDRAKIWHMSIGASAGHTKRFEMTNSLLVEVGVCCRETQSATLTPEIYLAYNESLLSYNTPTYRAGFRSFTTLAGSLEIRDCIRVTDGDAAAATNYGVQIFGTASVTVNRCNFILRGAANSGSTGINQVSGVQAVNVEQCLFDGYGDNSTLQYPLNLSSDATYTSQKNVFRSSRAAALSGRFAVNGANYTTPGDYLTAVQPGDETDSVATQTDQLTGDPTLRDYTYEFGESADTNGTKARIDQITEEYDRLMALAESL